MMHLFSIARTPNERRSVLEHAGVPLFQMREETLTQVRGSPPWSTNQMAAGIALRGNRVNRVNLALLGIHLGSDPGHRNA
jgi:hypothetical protein